MTGESPGSQSASRRTPTYMEARPWESKRMGPVKGGTLECVRRESPSTDPLSASILTFRPSPVPAPEPVVGVLLA